MSSDARIYSASALDGCAMMVYALSVLIILTALNALRLFRFSESWSDLFFHLSLFPWQPSGLGQRRLTGCLLKTHSTDSRNASGMTNATMPILCILFREPTGSRRCGPFCWRRPHRPVLCRAWQRARSTMHLVFLPPVRHSVKRLWRHGQEAF